VRAVAILVVSAAPAVAFLLLILRMDRREPEPLRLLLKVIGFGAVSGLVAGLVETALDGVPLFQGQGFGRALAAAFIQVAPVEELCKLGVVFLFAWRNPAFNEENDGIVYAGASAFGFALLENVLYVVKHGIGTGILRAFTSIPLHIFTGIVAGLFIGRARFAPEGRRRTLLLAAAFGLAWLFHGVYDAFAMSGSAAALLILPVVAGVSAFGAVALKRGRMMSLLRWDGRQPAPAAAEPTPAAMSPAPVEAPARAPQRRGVHTWMAVTARILFGASALFWALLAVGITGERTAEGRSDTLLGGVVLTFVPLVLATVLEWSYWARRKRSKIASLSP
jgi:protease PrsW